MCWHLERHRSPPGGEAPPAAVTEDSTQSGDLDDPSDAVRCSGVPIGQGYIDHIDPVGSRFQ